MKFISSLALSLGVLTTIALPSESLASTRILYNYQTGEETQARRRYSGPSLSPSLVEEVIKMNYKATGKDATEELREKFNFLKMSNIRKCIDIGFSREASNTPVSNHPKVIATYICSPDKAVIAFHIDDAGKEALYIIDIDESVVVERDFEKSFNNGFIKDSDLTDLRSKIQYFLSEEIKETRGDMTSQVIRYFENDPTWAHILLKQVLDPSSGKSDFLAKYGITVGWCDTQCLATAKANLEESGVYISRQDRELFESNGYVIVTGITPGSTASDLGCFPLGAWIPKTSSYPFEYFRSIDDFKKFASRTGFQRETTGQYGMGRVRVIDVANDFEETDSSNNSCKW